MRIPDFIHTLDKLARENTFMSIIILAIIGNLFYDLFKRLLFYLAISTKKAAIHSGRGLAKWNIKNIEFLISRYKEDIIKVEKIKNFDNQIIFELLHDIYFNVLMFFFLFVILYIISKFDNPIWFYAFLGSSSRYLVYIFASTYYNNSLFENSKKFEKFRFAKEKKIKLLQESLERRGVKSI